MDQRNMFISQSGNEQVDDQNSQETDDQKKKYQEFQKLKRSQQQQFQTTTNKFSYEFINKIEYIKNCYSIALNENNDHLLVSVDLFIKMFQFYKGQIRQISNIVIHQKVVKILKFLKQTNQVQHSFVSASDDLSLKLISIYSMAQTKYYQKLKGHTFGVSCMLVNEKGNLIITSSYDNTIKFWNNQPSGFGWICSQTISVHKNSVYCISLNEFENELISCGEDNLILVLEYQNLKWRVKQQIRVDYFGIRLCFIDMNKFIFFPYSSSYIQIYYQIDSGSQYRKTNDLTIAGINQPCQKFFPSNFNTTKQILFIKNGYTINIIKYNKKLSKQSQFELAQMISFNVRQNEIFDIDQKGEIFGTVSNNGEYLITWDAKSVQLQIRKYLEKQ